jgi:hypothetical protein
MRSFKKVAGILILLALMPVYVYGFATFRLRDILIPGIFLSLCGFALLGAIWLFKYAGRKEADRT